MKCELILNMAVSYLEHELSQDEITFFEKHLAQCKNCRLELIELTNTRNLTVRTLQSLADTADPYPQAWSRLQGRIAQESQKDKNVFPNLISLLAPGRKSIQFKQLLGEKIMQRSYVIPFIGAIMLAAFGFFFVNQNTKTVSAKQILEQAYEVHLAAKPASGIQHIRTETYNNYPKEGSELTGTTTVIENYHDFQTGNFRTVLTNPASGKIIEVFAYDGEITYSSRQPESGIPEETLTVYRSPQSRDRVVDLNLDGTRVSAEEFFNSMKADPKVRLEFMTTGSDGRKEYVLLSEQPVKMFQDTAVELQPGYLRMIFDANSYKLLETKTTYKKDGKEILVLDTKHLIDEVLPPGSNVAWDLSDLAGISLVDDLDRTQGDLLPEKTSVQELAAKTNIAYLLKKIPEGFDLVIEVPPNQKNETMFIYVASYRNPSNEYFVIQASGIPDQMLKDAEETFTTQSGLMVSFLKEPEDNSNGKTYQEAAVKDPDGNSFMVTSTLPRVKVKELVENLEIAK